MTTTQVKALRDLHDATSTQAFDAEPSMTAAEMALQSHSLDRAGDVAILPNGQRWVWRSNRNMWVRIP
jgi:hypothetical protein